MLTVSQHAAQIRSHADTASNEAIVVEMGTKDRKWKLSLRVSGDSHRRGPAYPAPDRLPMLKALLTGATRSIPPIWHAARRAADSPTDSLVGPSRRRPQERRAPSRGGAAGGSRPAELAGCRRSETGKVPGRGRDQTIAPARGLWFCCSLRRSPRCGFSKALQHSLRRASINISCWQSRGLMFRWGARPRWSCVRQGQGKARAKASATRLAARKSRFSGCSWRYNLTTSVS